MKMKQLICTIAIALLLGTVAKAQYYYQFLNIDGTLLLEGEYADYKYQEGTHFPVKKDKSWGIVDMEKGLLVDCIYEDVQLSQNSSKVFAVKKDGKWGVIDAEGNMLLKAEYGEVKSFDEEVAIVDKDFYWVLVNYKGDVLVAGEYEDASMSSSKESIWFKKDNHWELFSRAGKKLSSQSFSWVDVSGNRRKVSKGWHKTGVIDAETGKIVVPLKYDQVNVINHNLVEVAKCQIAYDGFGPTPRPHDYLYGIYSIALQKEVVPCTFDEITVKNNHIKAVLKGTASRSSYYTDQGLKVSFEKLESVKGLDAIKGTKAEKEALLKATFRAAMPTLGGYYVVENQKMEKALVNLDQHFIFPFGELLDIVPINENTFVVLKKSRNRNWAIMKLPYKWLTFMEGYYKNIEVPQSTTEAYPFVIFEKHRGFTVYNTKGEKLLATNKLLDPQTYETDTEAIYRMHDPSNAKVSYLKFSKDGKMEEVDKLEQKDEVAVLFKNTEGLYGLKKADGTILRAAAHKDIKMIGKEQPIFVLFDKK